MAFRFEFDSVNKILVARFEGRVTEELLTDYYAAARKYAIATDARAGIVDLSSVTEFSVSSEFIRQLARREPVMPDAERPRFIVAKETHAYGLFRMFQIVGEHSRPLLRIVRTMDEALTALGLQSPHFGPLE